MKNGIELLPISNNVDLLRTKVTKRFRSHRPKDMKKTKQRKG